MSDRLEVRAEVHGALVDQDLHPLRLDTGNPVQVSVQHMRLRRTDRDTDTVNSRTGDRAEFGLHANATAGYWFNLNSARQRTIEGNAGVPLSF
jgi:hypothetical protein